MNDVPPWFACLGDEDRQFLKRFVLLSGSLKDLATEYGVSYPTIRSRLDRVIASVQAAEQAAADDFERLLRVKVTQGALSATDARSLLQAHRACRTTKGD